MSMRFFVEWTGTRQSVTVTPMAPLSAVLEKACLLFKDKLDPSSCQLQYQKKRLDLGTPVRFANLPKDAKLELVAGQQQQRLGLSDQPSAQANAQHASEANQVSARHAQQTSLTPEQNTDQPAQQSHASSPLPSQMSADSQPNEQATSHPSAQPSSNSADTAQSTSSAALPAGLDRQVHVFRREAILAPGADARSDADLPAEFYEFTADDYQAVTSSWAKQKAAATGPLKTQKLRDQDDRRKAQQFGPVPVRIHWPDGTILQADFQALEALGSLQRLVQQCADTSLPKWYLYVTPPKQVLKDMGLNFYKAGLVPAANVYVGMESQHSGRYLRQQIAALEGLPPARPNAVKPAGTVSGDGSSGLAGASEFLPSKATRGGEKKLPKWMKLNK